MSFFPSIPEVVLAILAAILSLAVSLILLKIQAANTRSVKKLEEEQKILIAKQLEIDEYLRSRLITRQETQDAQKFIEVEALAGLGKIGDDLTALENRKAKISRIMTWGMLLMLLTSVVNIYLSFVLPKSGGKVNLSELIIVVFIDIFYFAYLLYAGGLLKKFNKDFSAIKQRLAYLSSEIARAYDLTSRQIK